MSEREKVWGGVEERGQTEKEGGELEGVRRKNKSRRIHILSLTSSKDLQ